MELTDFDGLTTATADDRGRVTIGSEFANENVEVYVRRTPDPEDLEEPPEDEKKVLNQMYSWAFENDIEVYDARPDEGVVIDTDGEMHETPHKLEAEA